MKKYSFTIFGNNEQINDLEKAINRYFRKIWNTLVMRTDSNKNSLTMNVTLWNCHDFENELNRALLIGLKGKNLLYNEEWYIEINE